MKIEVDPKTGLLKSVPKQYHQDFLKKNEDFLNSVKHKPLNTLTPEQHSQVYASIAFIQEVKGQEYFQSFMKGKKE